MWTVVHSGDKKVGLHQFIHELEIKLAALARSGFLYGPGHLVELYWRSIVVDVSATSTEGGTDNQQPLGDLTAPASTTDGEEREPVRYEDLPTQEYCDDANNSLNVDTSCPYELLNSQLQGEPTYEQLTSTVA